MTLACGHDEHVGAVNNENVERLARYWTEVHRAKAEGVPMWDRQRRVWEKSG